MTRATLATNGRSKGINWWLGFILGAGALAAQVANAEPLNSDTASKRKKVTSTCVERRAAAASKWQVENNLDPVVRADTLNEFRQECEEAETKTHVATQPRPATQMTPPTRAAAKREPLTPSSVAWLKERSLELSAATLPSTPGCNGVRDIVLNMLKTVEQRRSLQNRQFRAGVPASPDEDLIQIEILDKILDGGNRAATALSCNAWLESRRKVLWWFPGATKP